MDHHDDHLAMLAIAFLGGALAGTVAALLLAPAAGRVTRARLKDYAEKTGQDLRERLEGVREELARRHETCCGHEHKATEGPRAPVT